MAEDVGFQFTAEARVSDICVFLYGRPPDHQPIAPASSGGILQFGDIRLVSMTGEVPLALSIQEQSTVSVLFDNTSNLKINAGIFHYSIEDLLLYQITGRQGYLVTSLRPSSTSFPSFTNCSTGPVESSPVMSKEYVKIGFCSRGADSEEGSADNELSLEFNDVQLNCHRATIACLIAMTSDIIYCEYAPQETQACDLPAVRDFFPLPF